MNAENKPSLHEIREAGLRAALEAIVQQQQEHPNSVRLQKDAELCGKLLSGELPQLIACEPPAVHDPHYALLSRYASEYQDQFRKALYRAIAELHMF